MKILEPKAPGTLWATPGLLRDCFTFTSYVITFISDAFQQNPSLAEKNKIN